MKTMKFGASIGMLRRLLAVTITLGVASLLPAQAETPKITGVIPLPQFEDASGLPLGPPRIKVLGECFPVGQPGEVCLVLKEPSEPGAPVRSYPLRVVGIPNAECMIVEIPPLPFDSFEGELCMVTGTSVVSSWRPSQNFQNVNPLLPARVFTGFEPPELQIPPFPIDPGALPPLPPLPDPTVTTWFFSDPAEGQELCIILEGDWGRNASINLAGDITVKFQREPTPVTLEINAPITTFVGEGNLEECARRIKDIIRCVFEQVAQNDLQVAVRCIDPDTGEPIEPGSNPDKIKIAIAVLDPATQQPAQLCGGGFRICTTREKKPPTVDGYVMRDPRRLQEGSVVKIIGSGFGDADQDLVAQLCTTEGPVPLEILDRSENCLIVRVGPVPPGAKPLNNAFKVRCGQGGSTPWVPAFPELIPASPTRVVLAPDFESDRNGDGFGGPFGGLLEGPPLPPLPPFPPELIPGLPQPLPPEGVTYLTATIDEQGRFCLPLDTDWGPRSSISLLGTFSLILEGEEPTSDITRLAGFINVARTRLRGVGEGTAEDCAARLLDFFRCTLGPEFIITIGDGPNGIVLYIEIPGYDFEDGQLQLCLFRPFNPIDVTDLRPLTPGGVSDGSILELCADRFPRDVNNLCARLGDVPLDILSLRGEKLAGRLGQPLPLRPIGPLCIEPGRGARGLLLPAVQALQVPDPGWFFVGDGLVLPPKPDLPLPPVLPPLPDPEGPVYFHSEPVTQADNREICLYLEGEWCPGAVVRFEGHLQKWTAEQRWESYDWDVPFIRFPQGGSLEECARRLKDIPLCGFNQLSQARQALRWKCIPEDLDGDNVPDRVKLVVCCPSFGFDPTGAGQGDIPVGALIGSMTVCLQNPPKDDLEIKRISAVGNPSAFPVCVRECDLLCVEVCNAGCNPKDLCARFLTPNNQSVSLRVVEIVKAQEPNAPDKLIVQVGPLPADVPPRGLIGRLCLTRGHGVCGIWQPNIAGVDIPTRPTWVFDSMGNEPVYSRQRIQVKPTPTPQTDICFEGFANQDRSAICIDIDGGPWPAGTLVKVSGHFSIFRTDAAGGITARGVDLSTPIVRQLNESTAEDLSATLKDVWRCSLNQLAQIGFPEFKCGDDDGDTSTGVFKICPPPGAEIRGRVKVRLCLPPATPDLKLGAEKLSVCTGDTVCITGAALPIGMPDQYCVVAKDPQTGTSLFRLEVLSAEPDPDNPNCVKLICTVGVIPPGLDPGTCLDLGLSIASGKRAAILPVIDGQVTNGIVPAGNTWVWANPGGFPEQCYTDALEIGKIKEPPPRQEWLHAENVNGVFCLTISGRDPWEPGKNIRVDSHLALPQPFGHIDIQSVPIHLRNGGTAQDCAGAIKDVLRCAFRQLDGIEFVKVDCSDPDPASGDVKITIRWCDHNPERPETWLEGFMTLCCTDPPKVPVITDGPQKIETDGKYILKGECLDPDPNAYCVVFVCPDGTRVPMRVTQVLDGGNSIEVCVGPIPPRCDGAVGRIEVMIGRGQLANPVFNLPGIATDIPVWGWTADDVNAPPAVWDGVTACALEPQGNERWFFADVVNGKLCVTIFGNWPKESTVRVTARAHNQCRRLDLEGPQIRVVGEGSAEECAAKIKDFLRCAFLQQTGARVNVICDPIAGANAVKIVIEMQNGKPIDWGLCTICIEEGTSTEGDNDSDGLSNARERELGTNPNEADSDGDGLLDGEEINIHGTDPNDPDTDGDGCSDRHEVLFSETDPLDHTDCVRIILEDIDLENGDVKIRIPDARLGQIFRLRQRARLLDRDMLDQVLIEEDGDVLFCLPGFANTVPDSFFDIEYDIAR